jgi:hypothetical protein
MEQFKTSEAASLTSPTSVTNSIRSGSRSPARPRKSQLKQRVGPSSTSEPTPRRRPLGEMGKFTEATEGKTEAANLEFPRKMEPKIVGGLLNLNHNVLSCAGLSKEGSKEYIQEFRPMAKKNFALCADQTAVVASDFAVTAAEVYRVECRSDNRGRDSDFPGEENSIKSLGRSGSRSNKMSDVEWRDSYSDDNSKSGSGIRRRRSGSSSGKSPRSSLYPNVNTPQLDVSPPPVPRTSSANEFQPRVDNGNLMEARMELFSLGQSQESDPQTEVRLTKALQDMKRQDKVISGWKRQLEMTQQRLDETFAELEKTKNESQEKQNNATLIRSRAVQDRMKLQEMYQKETEQRRNLEEAVSKLQREVSSLKVSLRNARNSSGSSSASQPRGAVDSIGSGQIISLKAEIVELRSQLAEAHAASIDDHSTLHSSSGEVEELKVLLKVAEGDFDKLRKRTEDSMNTKKKFELSEKLLKDKIQKIESTAKETQKRLEDSLKAAVEEENQVRSELAKVKANVQRLERERSRKRIHSAADVERLTKQLERAKEEVTTLKEQQEAEEKAAKKESEQLKVELKDIKQKLFDATKEFASKATMSLEERMKMATEVKALRGEVMVLKNQLEAKTEETTSQATKIAGLEAKSKDIADRITSSRQITELQDEIKVLKDNEVTLRAEVTQYKSLLEKAKDEADKAISLREAQESDESADLQKLRSQVEELKLAEQKRAEEEERSANLRKEIVVLEKKVEFLQRKMQTQEETDMKVKAAEESLKNEIAILKAKLGESESKCTEERFRAEEERRISKEIETRYTEELDELRQENEKYSEDKLHLRQELEDLRKQMASGISASGRSVSTPTEKEGGAPSKVTKLRSELALARARLAAAREQTTMFSLGTSSAPSPIEQSEDNLSEHNPECSEKSEDNLSEHNPECSDRSSAASEASCWAPPGVVELTDTVESTPHDLPLEREEKSYVHDLDLGTEVPLPSNSDAESENSKRATIFSFWERSLIKEESKIAEESKMEESKAAPESTGKPTPASSPRSAFSFAEKSLIDEDAGETFPESSLHGAHATGTEFQTPERVKIDTGVDELRRQLQESSKRLEKANSRLNGLVDLPELKKANGFHVSPYRGINRGTFLTFAEEEKVGGVADEVLTSEAEGIEVQRVRFADI